MEQVHWWLAEKSLEWMFAIILTAGVAAFFVIAYYRVNGRKSTVDLEGIQDGINTSDMMSTTDCDFMEIPEAIIV